MIKLLTQYLNCPCKVMKPSRNNEQLTAVYHEASSRGKKEGFVPMFIVPDESLMEYLLWNGDEESGQRSGWSFNPQAVAKYRETMLRQELPDARDVLNELEEINFEEGFNCEDEFMGDLDGGEAMNDFSACLNSETVVLAEIPVKNPWEIFAWLPFGGWNECPDTPELMSVAKHWYETYGAVPAAMTHDVLEFYLPAPVKQEEALNLAVEQYLFCVDIVDQGAGSVTALADSLAQSTIWYFWWD